MRSTLVGTRRPWAGGSRVRLQDGVIAGLVMVGHLFPVRAGQAPVPNEPWADALVTACALGAGISLLWRRTHPRAVIAVVLSSYAGLALVQDLVPPYAAWVLIWSLATSGRERRRSITLSSGTAGATCALLVGAELSRPGVGALVLLVAVTALLALAAVLVRSERARVEAVSRRAASEERLRIARDLHDLVGHGLSTIAVQSSTARLALEAGEGATAARALAAVETSSRTAMREMRQVLGVLTDGESAPPTTSPTNTAQPSPGLADLPALVDNVRAGGTAVTFQHSGAWEGAAAAAQLVAYRVVQEGLTNAVKHAPGAVVSVSLTSSGDEHGTVTVETSGATRPGVHPGTDGWNGRGLPGLRTRVTAMLGELTWGPTDQGWLLEARLPLSEDAER